MLDSLIDRQDRDVARSGEPAAAEQRLQASQYAHGPIRWAVDPVHEIGTGQVQAVPGNRPALMLEQAGRLPESCFDAGER